MAKKPCILCDKEITAIGGSNTVFIPAPKTPAVLGIGEIYACCNEHGMSTSEKVYRIQQMPEDVKQRSRIE